MRSWLSTCCRVVLMVGALLRSDASSVQSVRNFKKGLSMAHAESCNAFMEHYTSSWWYSWATTDGFANSFCDNPIEAVSNARMAGFEFVPMIWGQRGVPEFDSSRKRVIDDEIHFNLQEAQYLLTFNEPELMEQANMSPRLAAELWPQIQELAFFYGLQIVAPCTTQDKGVAWYAKWLMECNNLYRRDCIFDFTCIHMYYQPYTASTAERCDSATDFDWACIQEGQTQGPTRAIDRLNQWTNSYPTKPIWVTEFSCAPWGSASSKTLENCSPEEIVDLMHQLTPVLEMHPNVFRYSWFPLYGVEFRNWQGSGLNENIWASYDGVGCIGRLWLSAFGRDATWKIQTMQQCLEKADAHPLCSQPVVLSIDDDSCYCSQTVICDMELTWPRMRTWKNIANRTSSAKSLLGELYETFGTTNETALAWLPPSPGT